MALITTRDINIDGDDINAFVNGRVPRESGPSRQPKSVRIITSMLQLINNDDDRL